MQLNDIQERFKSLMLQPIQAEDMKDVFESGRIPLDERLKIYRSNIIGSLTDVMKANYPVVEKLVGEEFFEATAKRFITNHPPEGGCLNQYGHNFAEFLSTFEPAQALPYLPDVARFEWAKQDAYYAADDQALSANELGKIAPEDLGNTDLKLRDNIRLISSAYPLLAIDKFCKENNDEGTLDLDQGGVKLMISRPHLTIEVLELDDASYEMLTQLIDGKTLGTTVETVLAKHESFDFQAFLQTHIERETFLTLTTNT